MTTPYEDFIAFDDRLAELGVPMLGAWWRAGLSRWFAAYERGEALELYACCGRGAAKSTVLYKLATFFALFGDFDIPIGERHYAIVLSRLKEEAGKGVAIISRWLTMLGVGHNPTGDVIELHDQPRGVRIVAASVAATSGWRAFFVGKDERSKWAESGIEERDAEEIDTSAAAMTATHANTPLVAVGSAWGKFGDFYDVVQAGDIVGRIVLGPAPTWIASDGRITEAMCRRKERDERRFRREYACEFQGSTSAAFDADAIARCFELAKSTVPLGTLHMRKRVLVLDPSSGKKDSWTWAIASSWAHDAGSFVAFEHIDGREGRFYDQGAGDAVVEKIAAFGKEKGVTEVHADQRESLMLASAFSKRGLSYCEHPWTSPSKTAAVEKVRSWMRDGRLLLTEHATLRAELHAFEERLTPAGAFTFGARGSGHDDYVALLVTAAMTDLDDAGAGVDYAKLASGLADMRQALGGR